MTTKADRQIREAIDRSLEGRTRDYQTYLAYPVDEPLYVERAELLYVFDKYGTQYLDFTAWDHPVGHNHPAIRARIAEQLSHYGRTGDPREHLTRWPVEYARMLSESLPNTTITPHQVLYTDTYLEALCAAMTIAQRVTKRVALIDGLPTHVGDVIWEDQAAMVLTFIDPNGRPVDPLAAQKAAHAAKQAGTLIIIDETRTGFGRTGTFWAQERYNIDADITVVSGPAGGGFPLGAVITARGFFELAQNCLVASPGAGHPVACAAGAETMSQINPGVLEHVTDVAITLNDGLEDLKIQFPDVFCSHAGLGTYHTLVCQEPVIAEQLAAAALSKGLLVSRQRDKIVLSPPLIISELEARRGVDLLADACLDVAE